MKLKCILCICDWFDPVVNRVVQFNKFVTIDANFGWIYNKFEHFILTTLAEQVSFIIYPRLRDPKITWLSAIKITPHSRIVIGEEPPLQWEACINEVNAHEQKIDDIFLIDPHNLEYEDLPDDTTDQVCEDEFDESDHCNDHDNSND